MKKPLLFWLAVPALALCVWAALWLLTFTIAQQQLQRFAAQSGGAFTYQQSGYGRDPFSVRLELQNVAWQLPNGMNITAPQLTLALMPGNWWRYHVVATQPVTVQAAWPQQGMLQLVTQRLDARLVLHQQRRWADFKAELQQAVLSQRSENAAAPEQVLQTASAQLVLHQPAAAPETHTETGLTIAVAVGDAIFAPGLLRTLPQHLSALTFNLRVMGAPPDWRQRAAVDAWRTSGGTLELDGLDFTWERLSGRMQATFALDAALQPQGAGTMQLFLDATAADANAPTGFANAVNMIFGLMAKTDAKTGVKSVILPLGLQSRQLALGIFPLTKLPEINWDKD